jgi:hypothetical protein
MASYSAPAVARLPHLEHRDFFLFVQRILLDRARTDVPEAHSPVMWGFYVAPDDAALKSTASPWASVDDPAEDAVCRRLQKSDTHAVRNSTQSKLDFPAIWQNYIVIADNI